MVPERPSLNTMQSVTKSRMDLTTPDIVWPLIYLMLVSAAPGPGVGSHSPEDTQCQDLGLWEPVCLFSK